MVPPPTLPAPRAASSSCTDTVAMKATPHLPADATACLPSPTSLQSVQSSPLNAAGMRPASALAVALSSARHQPSDLPQRRLRNDSAHPTTLNTLLLLFCKRDGGGSSRRVAVGPLPRCFLSIVALCVLTRTLATDATPAATCAASLPHLMFCIPLLPGTPSPFSPPTATFASITDGCTTRVSTTYVEGSALFSITTTILFSGWLVWRGQPVRPGVRWGPTPASFPVKFPPFKVVRLLALLVAMVYAPIPALALTSSTTLTPSRSPTISETSSRTSPPSATPTITPSRSGTPSITPSISLTSSVTSSETITSSLTPSDTPSVTPSITPSITPTLSITPTPSITPFPAGEWSAVVSGPTSYHTCAINAAGTGSGSLFCWGCNTVGQLGLGYANTTGCACVPSIPSSPVLTSVTAVALGSQHTCALFANATVACWGANDHGQLGLGYFNTSGSLGVSAVPAVTGVGALASGYGHTCAVTTGGSLYCWGYNLYGQLGNGASGADGDSPILVSGISNVSAVACGRLHTCILSSFTSVYCWGRGANGQLGIGNVLANVLSPPSLPAFNGAIAISAGDGHTCALSSGGGVYCWGRNQFGQLGLGHPTSSGPYGCQCVATISSSPVMTGVSQISAGGYQTCALKAEVVYCWGETGAGPVYTPSAVLTGVASVATGYLHSCALTTAGAFTCWGDNSYGQLGDGDTTQVAAPGSLSATPSVSLSATPTSTTSITPTPSITPFPAGEWSAVVSGNYASHTCAVKATGANRGDLYCWGQNDYGQLGLGYNSSFEPSIPSSPVLTGVTAVTLGRLHSCALFSNATVACWGYNVFGQLGLGYTSISGIIVSAVPSLSSVALMSAGNCFTCAATAVGSVYCWGDNSYGQLGIAGVTFLPSPTLVSGLSNVSAIACGSDNTCILTSPGALYCWGRNIYGQLGNGGFTGTNTPPGTPVMAGVIAIAAGAVFTCALSSSGGVYCWGYNYFGDLGLGFSTTASPYGVPFVPFAAAMYGVFELSAGFHHSCALKAGGVYCWGLNNAGQLGTGGGADMWSPPGSPLLTGVASVTAGAYHTCALTTGGAISCWGDNTYGQLGNGGVVEVDAPASLSTTPSISFSSSTTGTCTPSITPTVSSTASYSVTGSVSPSPSSTSTDTVTVTGTGSTSDTGSASGSSTATDSRSATDSPSSSDTPTSSITVTGTASSTPSVTATDSQTGTALSSPSCTTTQTESSTLSPSATISGSGSVSGTASDTVSATGTPSVSSTTSVSPSGSSTASDSESVTATDTTTMTPSTTSTPSATGMQSASDSSSGTSTLTLSTSSSPTHTESATISESPSPSESESLSESPSPVPVPSPSQTPSPSLSPTHSPLPPPIVVSSALSDTAPALLFKFSVVTNCGGAGFGSSANASSCAPLFDNSSLALFGSGNSCWWSDTRTLRVDLGADSPIQGGEGVTMRGGVVSRAAVAVYTPQTLLLIHSRKQPPNMTSAQLSSAGQSITVTFDHPSSGTLLGSSGAVDCLSVFENTNLGTNATCAWATGSNTLLQVTFGSTLRGEVLIVPADTIPTSHNCSVVDPHAPSTLVLRAGVIVAVTGGILSTGRQCVAVAAPASAAAPTILLMGPQAIGSPAAGAGGRRVRENRHGKERVLVGEACNDLTLDASNTVDLSGRGLIFSWAAVALNPEAAATPLLSPWNQSLYANSEGSVVTIPAEALAPLARYHFTVTVTTWLLASASASTTVSVGAIPAPFVSIDGPIFREVFPTDALTINAVATIPQCYHSALSGTTLFFDWVLLSATRNPVTTNASYAVASLSPRLPSLSEFVHENPSALVLPLLQVGVVYVIQVSVALEPNAVDASTATVTLSVVSGGVTAVLAGGDRDVGFDLPLILSGSAIDNDRIDEDPWRVMWSCAVMSEAGTVNTTAVCEDTHGTPLDLTPAGSYLQPGRLSMAFPPRALPSLTFIFSLFLEKGTRGQLIPQQYRNSTASVVIRVLPGTPPSVSLASTATSANALALALPTDDVTLSSSVEGHGAVVQSLEWDTVDLDPDTFSRVLLTRITTRGYVTLRLDLPPGTYVFSLTATNDRGEVATASIGVSVNGPPRNGYLYAFPSEGVALNQSYTLIAPKWVDDPEHLPLSYVFSYTISGVETLLQEDRRLSGTLSQVLLPAGEPSTDAVFLAVYVRDALGAVVKCTTDTQGAPVTIRSFPVVTLLSPAEYVATVSTALVGNLNAQRKVSNAVAIIAALAQTLNAANPCASVSCGLHGACANGSCVCASGYSGMACEAAAAPIEGVWSGESMVGACSAMCGGSVQVYARVCTPPLYGGAPCAGPAVTGRPCNTQACSATGSGVWSPWSAWSACSVECPTVTGTGGYYSGSQIRVRACLSDSATIGGQCGSGPANETQTCTSVCLPWAARCPGSSAGLAPAPNPLSRPAVECSGHGWCNRSPLDCRATASGTCVAVCACTAGWAGSDCSVPSSDFAVLAATRATLLTYLMQTWNDTNPTSDSIAQQASALTSLASLAADQFNSTAQVVVAQHCANVLQGVTYHDVPAIGSVLATVANVTVLALAAAVSAPHSAPLAATASSLLTIIDATVHEVMAGVLENATEGQQAIEFQTGLVSLSMCLVGAAHIDEDAPQEGPVAFLPQTLAILQAHIPPALHLLTQTWGVSPYLGLAATSAGMLSVTLSDAATGTEVPITGLLHPVAIRFTAPIEANPAALQCTYFDEGTGHWSSVGVIATDSIVDYSVNLFVLTCVTSHLTDFSAKSALGFLHVSPPVALVDAGKFDHAWSGSSAVTTGIMIGVVALCALAWFVSRQLHKRHRAAAEKLREAYMLRFGKVTQGVGMDGLGDGANARNATRLQDRLKAAEQRGKTALIVTYMQTVYLRTLRSEHMWLNVFLPPLDAVLKMSRPQRIVVLCVTLLAGFTVNAVYFYAAPVGEGEIALAAIYSTATMLPFTQLLPWTFGLVNSYKSRTVTLRSEIASKYKRHKRLLRARQAALLLSLRARFGSVWVTRVRRAVPKVTAFLSFLGGRDAADSQRKANTTVPLELAGPAPVLVDLDGQPVREYAPEEIVDVAPNPMDRLGVSPPIAGGPSDSEQHRVSAKPMRNMAVTIPSESPLADLKPAHHDGEGDGAVAGAPLFEPFTVPPAGSKHDGPHPHSGGSIHACNLKPQDELDAALPEDLVKRLASPVGRSLRVESVCGDSIARGPELEGGLAFSRKLEPIRLANRAVGSTRRPGHDQQARCSDPTGLSLQFYDASGQSQPVQPTRSRLSLHMGQRIGIGRRYHPYGPGPQLDVGPNAVATASDSPRDGEPSRSPSAALGFQPMSPSTVNVGIGRAFGFHSRTGSRQARLVSHGRSALLALLCLLALLQTFIGMFSCLFAAYMTATGAQAALTSAMILIPVAGVVMICAGCMSARAALRREVGRCVLFLVVAFAAEGAGFLLLLSFGLIHPGSRTSVIVIGAVHALSLLLALAARAWMRKLKREQSRATQVNMLLVERLNADVLKAPNSEELRKARGAVGTITAAIRLVQARVRRTRTRELAVWTSLPVLRLRDTILMLAYMIALLLIALTVYVNIAYGLSFTPADNRQWLISSSVAILTDCLFTEPVTVFVKMVLVFLNKLRLRPVEEVVFEIGRPL